MRSRGRGSPLRAAACPRPAQAVPHPGRGHWCRRAGRCLLHQVISSKRTAYDTGGSLVSPDNPAIHPRWLEHYDTDSTCTCMGRVGSGFRYAPRMNVDPASVWPLSAQLAQLLRELIRSGQLGPGEHVPSEPQLARKYSVSRDTAQRALAMLADEGLITRRRGVGSIVATVEPVTEVKARPGARISARLPTAAEQQATRAGTWVPLLAVEEPGWPEKLYPADRVVVVVPPEEDDGPIELRGDRPIRPEDVKPGGIPAHTVHPLGSCTAFSKTTP